MADYESRLRAPDLDALFDAVLLLRDRSECYRFFEDVCTISELKSIAQRFDVAKKLDEGVTYQEISQQLGASTATISRVNRALAYGAGGYRLLLDRIRTGKD
jgi:TrpR-related protein YerC/YecD